MNVSKKNVYDFASRRSSPERKRFKEDKKIKDYSS